jgi:hypothetical protein
MEQAASAAQDWYAATFKSAEVWVQRVEVAPLGYVVTLVVNDEAWRVEVSEEGRVLVMRPAEG